MCVLNITCTLILPCRKELHIIKRKINTRSWSTSCSVIWGLWFNVNFSSSTVLISLLVANVVSLSFRTKSVFITLFFFNLNSWHYCCIIAMGFNGQIFCNSVFNNILQVEQKTLEKEMGSLGLDMTNNDEVKLIN